MDKKILRGSMKASTILIACFLILGICKIFVADVLFTRGSQLAKSGEVAKGITNIDKAVKLNPKEPTYTRTAAFYWAELASYNKEAAKRAEILATYSYQLNPLDSLTLKKLIHTYYLLTQYDSRYYTKLYQTAKELVDKVPTEPKANYYWALVLTEGREYSLALEAVHKTLGLKNDFYEAIVLENVIKEALSEN